MDWKNSLRFALLIPVLLSASCGGMTMKRLNDATFSPNDFSVADMNQDAFRRTAEMNESEPVGEYAGLTGDDGKVTLVVEPDPGCYLAVATSESPMAELDVGAFDLDSDMVNGSLRRNDSFSTAGMAVRGFCLATENRVSVAVVTNRPRMGVVLSLYSARDADVLVSVVERLQTIESRGLFASLDEIVHAVDSGARRMAWVMENNAPETMSERETKVLALPQGAAAGACLAVVATGSGGSGRDVDVIIFTGEPPITREQVVAVDDRVNPNAAVAFAVPADPATVKVAITSYAGAGPVAYAAYSVDAGLCAEGRAPIPIPGGANLTSDRVGVGRGYEPFTARNPY